jgi:hypothetical protein
MTARRFTIAATTAAAALLGADDDQRVSREHTGLQRHGMLQPDEWTT